MRLFHVAIIAVVAVAAATLSAGIIILGLRLFLP